MFDLTISFIEDLDSNGKQKKPERTLLVLEIIFVGFSLKRIDLIMFLSFQIFIYQFESVLKQNIFSFVIVKRESDHHNIT